jgi:hypothetical protein
VKQAVRSRRVSHTDLPPSVLWRNRQIKTCLVLRSKPRNYHGDFEAKITKPKLPVLRPKSGTLHHLSFEAQPRNQLPVLRPNREKPSPPVLRPNWRKPSPLFLRPNQRKPSQQVLRPNRQKTSPPILRLNRQKPSKWFWGQTTHKPSTLVLRLNQKTRAFCLHVHGVDRTQRHPTSRSPGHRVLNLCDHP